MLVAKHVLSYGIRKTISLGFNTCIWTEPWIPDTLARPPQGLTNDRNPLICVNTLIDFTKKKWKIERFRELLPPKEITLILGIKPSLNAARDGYSWKLTKSGNYTVKTGYEAARAISRPVCDLPSQGPSVTTLKAQTWKLKTSRKLKHFVWQCVTGCVATCQRLHYRHIGRNKDCPRCGAEEETINHMLFECPPARQVWALSTITSHPMLFPSSSLYSNLDYLYGRDKDFGALDQHLRTFPWMMWYIWKARNKKVFENISESPQDTLEKAIQEEEVWRRANNRDTPQEVVGASMPSSPIPQDSIVCFIDGSWHTKVDRSVHGWIASIGDRILHVGLKGSRRSLSPLHAELDTLVWAMKCLLALDLDNALFATDCSDLLSMTSNVEDWPTFSSELKDFIHFRDRFASFSIRFIPREENIPADKLAKCARARDFCFSHVSSSAPNWLSFEESHSPNT